MAPAIPDRDPFRTMPTLAEIRAAGEAGRLAVERWPLARGAIDYCAVVFGRPLAEVTLRLGEFEASFPPDAESSAPFPSARFRAAWRAYMIMALEAASGTLSAETAARLDAMDDWQRLVEAARPGLKQHEVDSLLAVARQARADGIALRDVTPAWGRAVRDRLPPTRRGVFGNGYLRLARLQGDPAGIRSRPAATSGPHAAARKALPERGDAAPARGRGRVPPLPRPLPRGRARGPPRPLPTAHE